MVGDKFQKIFYRFYIVHKSGTSALAAFNQHHSSEWYMAVLQRVLFPCKNEAEEHEWEEKVRSLFAGNSSVVSDWGIFKMLE